MDAEVDCGVVVGVLVGVVVGGVCSCCYRGCWHVDVRKVIFVAD